MFIQIKYLKRTYLKKLNNAMEGELSKKLIRCSYVFPEYANLCSHRSIAIPLIQFSQDAQAFVQNAMDLVQKF